MRTILAILLMLPLAMRCDGAPVYGNPLSANVIYLDFTTFPSTATPDQIDQTARFVAAAYKPFDVAITTDFPGIRTDVAWCIIGGQFVPDPTGMYANLAGQSPVGVWHTGTTFSPFGTLFSASVYSDGMANDPTLVGRTAVHEIGHNFGLNHEDSGYMAPVPVFTLTPDDFHWTPEDVTFLASQPGLFTPPEVTPDTAEPGVLLVLALPMLMRDGRGRI